jgi:hypothetical protein
VELALESLGGKWKTVLLADFKEGPLRYSELRERAPRRSTRRGRGDKFSDTEVLRESPLFKTP